MTTKSPTVTLSRRDLLTATAALALTSLARPSPAAAPAPAPIKKIPVGLELFSVRTELTRNLPNTLKAVAKMGYEIVEFYSPYAAWKFPYAKTVRTLLDDLNLRCLSTHNHIESFTPGDANARAIELNQILGSRLLVLAADPPYASSLDGWKRLAAELTAATTALAPHGLTAGFHNHQTQWAKIDSNTRIMDLLAANTPKEFVLQLDVGTCVDAGADPVAWILANPGRSKVLHLKDWAPGTRAQEKEYRVLFGEGVCPWKEILAAAESVGGVEFYLIEQEGSRFPELETAQRCLDAWNTLRNKP